MKKYTILLNRSKVINFVVFMKDDDSDKIYSDICQNPKDNAFDLNEGVSILVKCLTNVTIQEWHSINSSSINIISRATWEAKKKPRFTLESRTLSVGNREAIEGKVLRAVIIKESRAIGEYFPKLIEALEEAGNFSFTFVENDERGIYDEDKKTWSGAMGLVVNKQVDIALGWFTYLPNGFSVVDYTVTIDRAEFVILIKEPKTKTVISWTAFFQPFTLETWLALLFLFIIIQVIRVFLKSKTRSSSQEQTFGADDFFHICGIFLHKHQPNISEDISIRIFYIFIIIFSFYIWAIYSAAFVSKLSIIDINVPFKSLEEFTRVKSHKMIVFQDTSNYYKLKNAKQPLLKKANELLICNRGMALFTDDMFLAIAYNNSIPNICRMVTIRTNEFDSFALILKKNSPYTLSINHYLRRFLNNGIMSRLKCILAESTPIDLKSKPENTYQPVNFMDIVMPLTILFGSALTAILIFLLENFYLLFRRKQEIKNAAIFQLRFNLNKNVKRPSKK
ncbi:uncharacterized protein LOC122502329 isoform X2 [Leptopilina heterotoma]|uniref:uncharacterized protein LOC122502329 isoform X2 n=1 Tax=Leptopilina heterotoma TaxID=63436 RepID=UPI001CA93C25|nr:uncharacterized protein LOC122502329 isoform X2 [Leptopilina heterotoma]